MIRMIRKWWSKYVDWRDADLHGILLTWGARLMKRPLTDQEKADMIADYKSHGNASKAYRNLMKDVWAQQEADHKALMVRMDHEMEELNKAIDNWQPGEAQ